MDRSRTIGQLVFAAALLMPATAFAVCDAGDFFGFLNCMFVGPPGETIRLTANISPDGSQVNVGQDRTVNNNGFGLVGNGNFIKAGAGKLTFPTGNGGYSGNVVIQQGTIAVGSASSLGTGALVLFGASSLLLQGSFDPLLNSQVSLQGGTPRIAVVSGATSRLNNVGTSLVTPVTFGDAVNNGALKILGITGVAASTTVTLAGGNVQALDGQLQQLVAGGLTIASGAKLVTDNQNFVIPNLQGAGEISLPTFSRTLTVGSGTYSGVISGIGTLVKNTAGELTLTGTNTYSGGTTISGGILRIGDGGTTGTLGSGSMFINNSELRYKRTDTYQIAQQIGGNGTIRMEAAGTLTLSGTNGLGISVAVDLGTVSVTGSWPLANVTVLAPGVLKGTGTVGNVNMIGGEIRPGLSPGAIATNSLTMGPGSTLQIQVNGGTPGLQYDQVSANLGVSLNSATLSLLPTIHVPVAGESFVLINKIGGGPIAGTFAGVNEGSATSMNGVPMFFSYAGGDGNDFVLSVLTRTVTPTVVPHGTITPPTPKLVIDNTTTMFTIVPDTGYTATVGGNCAAGSFAGATYTTGAITADCTVTPIFTLILTPQSITFGTLANQAYGSAPFTVSATGGGSGNPVVFSSATTAVCTTSGTNGTTVTIVATGLCTIAADQAGNATFAAAPQVTQSFTVTGIFRAYLSKNGSDANPCTLGAPCRLLPAALTVVNAGGEIWMLDSANFNTNTVTIAKSVTILAVPGALGSIVANGSDALLINATNVEVTLRNLVILNLTGTVHTGIQFFMGSQVTVEGCEIYGVAVGIDTSAPGGLLTIKDTTIRDTATGVLLHGSMMAVLDRAALLGNGSLGMALNGGAQATVSESTISGSATGVSVAADSGTSARLALSSTELSGNGTALQVSATASGDTAHAVLEDVTITHNGTGVAISGAGNSVVFSRQNNALKFNGTDVTGGALTPQAAF